MAEFVNYKEIPLDDKVCWDVGRDFVRGGVGNEIGWKIEYKPVWANDERIDGWKPKVSVYAPGGMAEVVLEEDVNYKIKVDEAGVYIDYNRYNPFESAKPVEKRGLYDLYIDNRIDIPESISKESPCYKQFMKEKEANK